MWFISSIIALLWIYYVCNLTDRFLHELFNSAYTVFGDRFVMVLGSLNEENRIHRVRTRFMPILGVFLLSIVLPFIIFEFYNSYSSMSQISAMIYAFTIMIFVYLFISSITDSEKDSYQKSVSIVQYLIIGFSLGKFFNWLLYSELLIPDTEIIPLLLLVIAAEISFVKVPDIMAKLAEDNTKTKFKLYFYHILFKERSYFPLNFFKFIFVIYGIGIAFISYVAFISLTILSIYGAINLTMVVQYIVYTSLVLVILTLFAMFDYAIILSHSTELLTYESKIPATFRPDINFILDTLWPNIKLRTLSEIQHVPIFKIKTLTPQECYALTIVGINELSDVDNFSLVNIHIETKVTYEVLSNLEYIYKRFQSFLQSWNKFIGEYEQAKNIVVQ